MSSILTQDNQFNLLIETHFFFSFLPYRLYPVVIGNGRNLQSDAVINGFHVPKGVKTKFN